MDKKRKTPHSERINAADVMTNRKHMLALCEPNGIPMALDLSDDQQFQFVLNERGGREYLEAYFPHHFDILDDSRRRAIEARKSGAAIAPSHLTLLEKAADGQDVSTEWQDLIQICGLVAQRTEDSATHEVQASALVTFVEGLEVFSGTLSIINTKTGEGIAQTVIPNLYDRGRNLVIAATGKTDDLSNIRALMSVDYKPYGKPTEHKFAQSDLEDEIDPIELVVTDPVHRATIPNEGFIKVCMGRHDSDCDYQYAAQPQPQPPVPYIAVSGHVKYEGAVTQPSEATVGVYFWLMKRGGGAVQPFTSTSKPYTFFSLDGPHTMKWNFAPASFATAIWSQGQEVDLNLFVRICVDSQYKNTAFQVTSLVGVNPDPSHHKIDMLRFFWGCFSADTMVLLEDGSEKRVDTISIGDHVRASSGAPLRVRDIVTGTEEKPCLRIETEAGRSLLVTDEHPIARHNGFCLAKELAVGDLVRTEYGKETVCSIAEEAYDGVIYNLLLADENGPSETGAAHYANGLLVGDGAMQGALLQKRREERTKPRSIEDLPDAWRLDAQNSQRIREGKELVSVDSVHSCRA